MRLILILLSESMNGRDIINISVTKGVAITDMVFQYCFHLEKYRYINMIIRVDDSKKRYPHIVEAMLMNSFTEKGKCYWMKVYEIPEGTRTSKGRAIQNLIQIDPQDKVKAFINVQNLIDHDYINNN